MIETSAKDIESVCESIKTMLLEKNKQYGNSALNPMRIFARGIDTVTQLRVRIDDKLSRLARGTDNQEDTELDLIGYLILLRVARDRASAAWLGVKQGDVKQKDEDSTRGLSGEPVWSANASGPMLSPDIVPEKTLPRVDHNVAYTFTDIYPCPEYASAGWRVWQDLSGAVEYVNGFSSSSHFAVYRVKLPSHWHASVDSETHLKCDAPITGKCYP
jgi:hypothetical protein